MYDHFSNKICYFKYFVWKYSYIYFYLKTIMCPSSGLMNYQHVANDILCIPTI
jgi:hypothetical protein